MKCPHCSFDNLDDAPFCENCGHVFLSSDRVPEVPDPADLSRRRDTALDGVPPIVQVPSIAPADSTGVIRERPSVPEVVPSATGAMDRSSVADLAVPLPDPPREPDFSGFERLVDSSYVPPAAAAGDTAEIPVIRDEYVPHARNYTLGLTPREQRKRDREQRKLEKKFAKAQRKEEARAAKAAAREEAQAAREAAQQGEVSPKEASEAAVVAPAAAGPIVAEERDSAASAPAPDRSGALSLAASQDGDVNGEPGAAPALPAVTRVLPPDDLAGVLMTGDGVVSLFEKSSHRHPARGAQSSGALELPGTEQGIVVAGERGIESTRDADADTADDAGTSAIAVVPESAWGQPGSDAQEIPDAPAEPRPVPDAQGVAPEPTTCTAAATPAGASEGNAPSGAAGGASAPKVSSGRTSRNGSAQKTASSSTSRPKRSKTPVIIAVVVALIVALLLVAGGTYMAELWGGKTVPEVVSMTRDEAIAALESEAFSVEATEVKSDEAAGTVLSESPSGGSRVEEGSTIVLEIATPRVVPDVKGASRDEAAEALAAEGFTDVEYKEKKSNKAEGTVLKVSPKAGTEALSTEPITLTVAVPFTVPDVAGMDTDAAKEALADEGYEVTTLWSYTEDTPEGTALYTEPEAGTQLDSGSEVTLYIAKSRGSELVALAESFLPGARLKNNEGRFIIDSVSSVTYAGDDVVRYTCEAHQYEDVELPFGKGTTRVEDDKRVTIEGSLTFNSDNVVTTADPAISY